ncbi:hypothetical protein AOR10_24175, partial [Vibrio alginolyticus]
GELRRDRQFAVHLGRIFGLGIGQLIDAHQLEAELVRPVATRLRTLYRRLGQAITGGIEVAGILTNQLHILRRHQGAQHRLGGKQEQIPLLGGKAGVIDVDAVVHAQGPGGVAIAPEVGDVVACQLLEFRPTQSKHQGVAHMEEVALGTAQHQRRQRSDVTALCHLTALAVGPGIEGAQYPGRRCLDVPMVGGGVVVGEEAAHAEVPGLLGHAVAQGGIADQRTGPFGVELGRLGQAD